MKLARALVPRWVKRELRDHIRRAVSEELTAARPSPTAGAAPDSIALRDRVAELEASLGQFQTILRRETSSPPPPPKHLQVRVVGAYVPGFLESGFAICDDLNAVLNVVGKKLADFPRILDWGCGCGRTTRALKDTVPASEIHGTDIDPEAIDWLRQNYSRFADFRLAPHLPPLPYADGTFDFVFGISIFTHLPEDMQFRWLEELRRISRPGGYVLVTTSGETNYRQTRPEIQAAMAEKGFFYDDLGKYGQSISLPDFYQNTFHSIEYIRREWATHFEIVDIQPVGLQNHQDTILMKKRA
jgi:SAM-dependent methyltransferase